MMAFFLIINYGNNVDMMSLGEEQKRWEKLQRKSQMKNCTKREELLLFSFSFIILGTTGSTVFSVLRR